jgi:hypothetical protein
MRVLILATIFTVASCQTTKKLEDEPTKCDGILHAMGEVEEALWDAYMYNECSKQFEENGQYDY